MLAHKIKSVLFVYSFSFLKVKILKPGNYPQRRVRNLLFIKDHWPTGENQKQGKAEAIAWAYTALGL